MFKLSFFQINTFAHRNSFDWKNETKERGRKKRNYASILFTSSFNEVFTHDNSPNWLLRCDERKKMKRERKKKGEKGENFI